MVAFLGHGGARIFCSCSSCYVYISCYQNYEPEGDKNLVHSIDSETATMTGALSDSKLSKPRPVPDDSPDKAVELKSSDTSWLDGLLDLHQLSKKLSVNVCKGLTH